MNARAKSRKKVQEFARVESYSRFFYNLVFSQLPKCIVVVPVVIVAVSAEDVKLLLSPIYTVRFSRSIVILAYVILLHDSLVLQNGLRPIVSKSHTPR